jgi:hypothetical protein
VNGQNVLLFGFCLWVGCSCPEASSSSRSSADRRALRREIAALPLATLPRSSVSIADKGDHPSVYEGVSISEILRSLDVPVGAHPKGRPPVESVVFEGEDGYRALFSKAELDPAFTDRTVLLANKQDGRLLPAGEGPWRLIVPSDKIRSRWVKQVKAIEVHPTSSN